MSTEPTLRSIEIELAATPEEVWEAIATSTGISGWLFPTELDGRLGGEVRIDRRPYGGVAEATVSAWEPPHRFAYDEPRSTVPGGSDVGEPWATEFLVEARAGGTCVVRVVSGFHRHGEAWEPFVDGAAEGWRGALTILAGYVRHFRGQPVAVVDATTTVDRPPAEAAAVADGLLAALGLRGLSVGDRFEAPAGAPVLAGTVEALTPIGALLVADRPAPALVEVSGFWMGGDGIEATVALRYYGDDADALAAEHGPAWQAWIASGPPGPA